MVASVLIQVEPTFNNAFHAYMKTYALFKQWSETHVAALLVSLACIVFIPLFSKRYLNPKLQHVLGSLIGISIFLSYAVWMYLEVAAGTWDIKQHLPMHLCRFSNLAILLVMIWRKRWWYELLYFWALGGMLQASITPDLVEDYPHYMYFRFWFAHTGMILAIVYATVVYEFRPQFKHLLKAMIGINVFLVAAAIVNLLLDANYFWICGKPPTASILDLLGPWPYYVFFAEFIALANFAVAYVPWFAIDYYAVKKRKLTE